MVKGVNRQVVELTQMDCEYFERVVFFIKPEFSATSEGTLRERAGLIAAGAGLPPVSRLRRSRSRNALKLGLAALAGAAASAGVTALAFLL